MKNIIYYLAALSAIVLVGCSQTPDDIILEQNATISVSRSAVSFPEEGGEVIIAVSSNTEWTYSIPESWIDVSSPDMNSLRIKVGNSSEEVMRSGAITLIASNAVSSSQKIINVVQIGGAAYVNLSAEGTANSYIAKPNGYYRFNASVKGNGVNEMEGAPKAYIEAYGVEILNVDVADLLWEATFNGDKTKSKMIIESMPVYIDGEIYFQTGSVEGNALIAAKKIDGEILWSWHIWVLQDDIKTVEGNSHIWMDRNLGAINNTPGDINNRGLFYQWGRKDPFLPTNMTYPDAYDGYTNLTHNTQIGDGSGAWDHDGMAALVNVFPGNLPFSIRNPMSFIRTYSSSVGGLTIFDDWYMSAYPSNKELTESRLWGDDSLLPPKTIFDPCPVGYTVPPKDSWKTPEDYPSDEPLFEEDNYGVYWLAGSKDYFPLVGQITSMTGKTTICGRQGIYWSKEPSLEAVTANRIVFKDKDPLRIGFVSRGAGYSVRCVKEDQIGRAHV